MIATATNTVVATVPVGPGPSGVAVTPDGKHVYVTNVCNSNTVSVIATASNTVVATVPVGINPHGGRRHPGRETRLCHECRLHRLRHCFGDRHGHQHGGGHGPGGERPVGVGIVPPPPGVPFLAFNAQLEIQFGSKPNLDAFGLGSGFMLSSTAPAINPLTEPVTLQIGTFATTIPPGP